MASRVTYQNVSPEVTRKPWRVMSPDAMYMYRRLSFANIHKTVEDDACLSIVFPNHPNTSLLNRSSGMNRFLAASDFSLIHPTDDKR